MKIICSASKGVNAQVDTANLGRLLGGIARLHLQGEIVLGHWQGKREISVCVRGFTDLDSMGAFADWVLRAFEQEAVYGNTNAKAWLYQRGLNGALVHPSVGLERWSTSAPPSGVDCYTEFLDGRILYTTQEVV